MKLHEYQAKRLFSSVHIPIPRGVPASSPQEARRAYETLQQHGVPQQRPFVCAVKVQIHAGGRGKAGGIVSVESAEEAAARAAQWLGQRCVTRQTGAAGLPVSTVLIEERMSVHTERYLAVTIDRFHARPMVLASRQGGMDIEAVAHTDPQAIQREPFDVEDGLTGKQLAQLAAGLGYHGMQAAACRQVIRAMWELFVTHDASLIEINPLVTADDGRLVALDAKVTLDDNALFRHPDLAAWRDTTQEDVMELKAAQVGISYVGLQGTIGCLVNGAGLAMATNDIITLFGGKPANFLDVGGGASVEQVSRAFSIILADRRVNAVLVNIFGGIMRCDWIAQGLLNATHTLDVKVPIVVRLEGTNVEEGRRLLAQAKRLPLVSVDGLAEAARKVVELATR